MKLPSPHAQRIKHSLLHVAIELFFAILPLIILGAYWPSGEEPHPEYFRHSPEWSMTACILYGLALSRFQLGMSASGASGPSEEGSTVAAITILPLLGVIFSVILISKAAHGTGGSAVSTFQFINLGISLLAFVFLGGYGLSRAEGHPRRLP